MLDKIAEGATSDDYRIVEMLDHWLSNYKEKLTWRRVINVLKEIDLQQLAMHIEKVYVTGKNRGNIFRDSVLYRITQTPSLTFFFIIHVPYALNTEVAITTYYQ